LPQLHLKMAVDLLLAAKIVSMLVLGLATWIIGIVPLFFCQERLVKQERK